MTFQIIECPSCGRKYQVGTQNAGKAFQCRSCNEVVPIPEIQQSRARVAQPEARPQPRTQARQEYRPEPRPAPNPPQRAPRRQQFTERDSGIPARGIPKWVVATVSVVVTVLAVVGVQAWLSSGKDSAAKPDQDVQGMPVASLDGASNQPSGGVLSTSPSAATTAQTTTKTSNQPEGRPAEPTITTGPPPATDSASLAQHFADPNGGTSSKSGSATSEPSTTDADPRPVDVVISSAQPTMRPERTSVAPEPSESTPPKTADSGTKTSATPPPASAASTVDADDEVKPGTYGKGGFAIRIPAGFTLTDVRDDDRDFEAHWRLMNASPDAPATISLDLRYDARVIAGSRPPMFVESGVMTSTSGEMFAATGGTVEPVSLDRVTFYKMTYPQRGSDHKIKWLYLAHFEGVRVKIQGESTTVDESAVLEKVAMTFKQQTKDVTVPKLPELSGFGSATVASATPSPTPAAGSNIKTPPAVAPVEADGEVRWGTLNSRRSIMLRSPSGSSIKPAFSAWPPLFVQHGQSVYDVTTGEVTAELPPEFLEGKSAISTDGKRVAQYPDDSSHEVPAVFVYSTEDPAAPPVRIENSKGKWRINMMRFLDGTRLIMNCRDDDWMVWDTLTGKRLTQFEGDVDHPSGISISADGKYMAVSDRDGVVVFDTARGRVAARMANAVNGQTFNLFWCSGLSFSSDMTELAGLFSDGQFIVWSNKGEVILHEILPNVSSGVGQDNPSVFWLPDNKGWFIDGNKLLDRETMTFVWEIAGVPWHDTYSSVMDQNSVMTTRDSSDELVFIDIPWDKIHAGIDKVQPGTNAILTRGGSVSIQFNATEVRFSDAAQVKNSIVEAITKRLGQNDVSVAENQDVTVVINYSEKAGPDRRVRGMFGRAFGGNAAETVVQDTLIHLSAEMRVAGRQDPVWKDDVDVEAGMIVDVEELTPQAFRNENFRDMLSRVERFSFPTRIARDQSIDFPVKTHL